MAAAAAQEALSGRARIAMQRLNLIVIRSNPGRILDPSDPSNPSGAHGARRARSVRFALHTCTRVGSFTGQ